MVALQIRHVPEQIWEALTAEARRRGESLQVYLLEVLAREAAAATNRGLARRWLVQPLAPSVSVDVSELIARQRADREHHLTDTALTDHRG